MGFYFTPIVFLPCSIIKLWREVPLAANF